jgi:hypothetical protein
MPSFGTRGISRERQLHPAGGSLNHSYNADAGMSKLANGVSATFSASTVSAANGTFSAFAVGDTIEVIRSNLNSGYWTVDAIDAANGAFLTLDGSPKTEGPIVVVIRTP